MMTLLERRISIPKPWSMAFRIALIAGYCFTVVRSFLLLADRFTLHHAVVVAFTCIGIVVMAVSLFTIKTTRRRGSEILVTGLHLALPLFLAPTPPGPDHAWTSGAAAILMPLGAAISAWGLLSLWESFAILPGLKRLKTHGAYRIVRHPIYAGYMLSAAGLALLLPSIWNLILLGAVLPVTLLRIHLEECFLLRSESYRKYASETPWRIVPRVF